MPLPAAVVADGSLKVLWVPTLAVQSAPTFAELTAPSVVDLSCYLTQFAPSTNEGVVNDNRICSTATLESPGKATEMLQTQYVYNPKVPASDAARLALIRFTLGYIVGRWGVLFSQAIAAGDEVDVWPVKCGKQVKQEVAENEMLKIAQKLFVYDIISENVLVAA